MSNGPPVRRRTSGGDPRLQRSPTAGMRSAGLRVASDGVKLVCTAGPKAGQEFPLGSQDVVIGRATDNAISIPDTSVSRKHLKLRKASGGWLAVDLGSGNGTLVNGELIADETVLGNGDVLALGDTEFTFVDEANATDRRENPLPRPRSEAPLRRASGRDARVRSRAAEGAARGRKRKRGPMLLIVFLMTLIVVSLAGLKLYTERKLAVERKREAEIAALRAEISALFQEGKNLVRQGRWGDAKVKFEQVREQDSSYPMVQDYLDRANREIPNQVQLNAAEAALKESKLNDAVAALGKVSQDTQQFEKLKQIKEEIEKRHAERMAEAEETMKTAAQVSICNVPPGGKPDGSRYEEVIAITEDLLQAFPEDREAKALNEDARERLAACLKTAAPVQSPRSRVKESDEVAKLFADGEPANALQAAQACASRSRECRQKASQITEFMSLYRKLDDLEARGLQQLLTLDRRIGEGRRSKMGLSAGTKAANIYYKSAAAAKTTGSWSRANEYASLALAADPNHAGAKALVEEMQQKAKDLYFQAYANMHTDPEDAATKFRDVISMTPRGDEWRRKAESRLQEIGK